MAKSESVRITQNELSPAETAALVARRRVTTDAIIVVSAGR